MLTHRPGMTGLPSSATAGLRGARGFRDRTGRNAYRKDWIGRGVRDALGDDLGRDAADAVQADRMGRGRGEV
jgi:hypothetical protein